MGTGAVAKGAGGLLRRRPEGGSASGPGPAWGAEAQGHRNRPRKSADRTAVQQGPGLAARSLRAGSAACTRHGVPAPCPRARALAAGGPGNVPACIGTVGPGGQRILFSERCWEFLCEMVFLNVGQFVSRGLVWLPVTESLNDSGESATDVFLSPEAQTAHRRPGRGVRLRASSSLLVRRWRLHLWRQARFLGRKRGCRQVGGCPPTQSGPRFPGSPPSDMHLWPEGDKWPLPAVGG